MNDHTQTLAADLQRLLAELAHSGVRLSRRGDTLQCDAPRGALNSDARALLSARKGEIMAFLDQRSAPAIVESPLRRIAPARPGTPVPLSFSQRRLWVQAQLDDTSAAYNMRTALALDGELDVGALDRAVAALVRRHAALRTGFATCDGEAVQIVADDVELAIAKIDLQALAEPERAAELDRLMARAAGTPFELDRAPLLRVALVHLAPRRHVLLVTLHHLIGDGVSLGILASEIRELYAAACEARAPRLPELPVQYTEFATWQRQALDDQRLAALRAHWVEALRGAPPVLELPTDRPRTAGVDLRGAIERFAVPADLADELRALSRAGGTTLFMTLLTGFAVVLARYSHQSDLVIGCPISQRTHEELEPVIGMFVNSLALRIRIQDNPTIQELLEHVRVVAVDAYAHKDLPLDQLVEALNPERSLSHHPVYQTMFIHDNAPTALPEVCGVRFDILEHSTFDAKFDLMLSMNETPDGIRGVWEYRCALFDRATLRRATEHLLVVLRAMVRDPRARVMQVPLLTAAERHQALEVWSRNGRARATDRSVLELIDDQIAAAPAAPAVAFGADTWSYAELDRRARQLARHLRTVGVRVGDRVAVLLPRSPELLASLLAVLRAGAAYIPLDPSYPSERIGHQLDDGAPTALITSHALAAGLAAPASAIVVRVDADAEAIARAEAELPAAGRAPDEPAYLMYTSGSTGRPKAAIVTHRGLANYLTWSVEAYAMTAGTRAAVSTSVAFDATITTLWSPVVAGGTVVLLPEGEEITALAALLQTADGVDLVKLTPSHIDALRAHVGDAVRPGGTRVFVIGGEQLLGEQVAWCQSVAPRARVINEYGPTETVVGCCIHEIAPGASAPDIVPIGRPIDNTELYVLSPWREPVPAGVPGELYIGGAGVALGYRGRPELTAEKFVDHPFSRAPGARLYRSGDRVVWSADGDLRFLDRVDSQVKVRGFRIELGEIDARLARHPAVREAVTVVRDVHGRSQLVSYVVTSGGELTVAALRDHLSAWLPDHMVPAVVVFLPALPLTPNGKLDRGALPSPAPAPGSAHGPAPADGMERELAELWTGILGCRDIGRDDNFFELGGDSILGIQLVARARERGIQLTPRQLFENQTVALLAVVARRDVVAAARGPELGPVALGPSQRWFFAEALAEPHHFNQSIVLALPATVDAAALGRALGQVVAHHDVLRSRFTTSGAEARAEIVPPGPVELAITDWSQRAAADGTLLQAAIADAQAALRLDGPLFVPRLFLLGAQARLLLTAHHLLVDGVSWRILVEDLVRAYEAEAAGAPQPLPPRTAAYGEWVARLTAWATSPELMAEQAYWTAVPDGPQAQLPLDAPCDPDANRAGDAAELTRALSAEATRTLRESSSAAYNVNVQEVLLAALMRSLSEAGEPGVLTVDVEGHGREDVFEAVDVSRTVGWFTSVFPVHLPLDGGADPAAALTAVKEQLRAVPHAGLGFGVLRYLSPDPAVRAALAAAPVAQIRFNYFGQLDAGQRVTQGFALAAEPCEPQRSALGQRRHLLDLNAQILDGKLAMTWTYSRRLLEPQTVAALADRFLAALDELAAACTSATSRHYTPSDFPDVELSQDNLDQLLADIARANEEE